jgi:hypothetical protein
MSGRTTLVVATLEWSASDSGRVQERMEEADQEEGNKPRSLPLVIRDRIHFMCPGALHLKQWLLADVGVFRTLYPTTITDAEVWRQTVGWIRTWCRSDRDAFIRDTEFSDRREGPDRVDVIHVDSGTIASALDPMKDTGMGCEELVDALAGRPKTMQTWFLTPFLERRRKFIVDALADEKLFDQLQPTFLSPKLGEISKALQEAGHFTDDDMVHLQVALNRGLAIMRAPKKADAVQRRKAAQEDLRFLEDVLAGRRFDDAERLFRIVNPPSQHSDGNIPRALDPLFWHAEAVKTWKLHSDRKYEVKSIDDEYRNLSWPARIQLRLLPERALVRYIKLHYPQGSGHVIADDGYVSTFKFARLVLPFHPVIRAAQSKQVEADFGTSSPLSDLVASYAGKARLVPSVRLLRGN